jgi:hypothetical protein
MIPRRNPRAMPLAAVLAVLGTAAPACSDYDPAAGPTFPDVSEPDVSIEADVPVLADVADTTGDPLSDRPEHCSDRIHPGPAPLRRLTKTEYNNTVRDLLGDETRPADRFPPEEETLGFDNNASGRGISQIHVEMYMQAAEQLVRDAMLNRRDRIVQCDTAVTDEQICAMQTIDRFGRMAYRRPLTQREKDRYLEYFDTLRATETFDESVTIILEVILQSPHFLYRTEFGRTDDDGDGVVMLTPFELATRISYLLWGAPPDDMLLAAAEIGLLDTAEGIASEARRMLEDPRARQASLHFHKQWLYLKRLATTFKDPELLPEYTPELRDMLEAETKYFVDHVIFDGEGDFVTLMAAPYSFLNKRLAEHYGHPSDGMSDEVFQKYFLRPNERAGVLTHGSTMAVLSKFNQTSPVLRGHFIREHILCQYIAPPPADINITPPDLNPNLTTRERFRQHNEDPNCAGCHARMDPIGLPFENYDPLGRWRDKEGELDIDSSGEIKFTWDVNGPVANGIEVVQRLAMSEEVRQCYATQWFRYAHGRDIAFDDACHLWDLMQAFEKSDWNIKELLVALTQTEAFRYRAVVVPGSDAPTDF